MADLRPTAEMRRGIGVGSLDTQRPASAPDRQPLRKKRVPHFGRWPQIGHSARLPSPAIMALFDSTARKQTPRAERTFRSELHAHSMRGDEDGATSGPLPNSNGRGSQRPSRPSQAGAPDA